VADIDGLRIDFRFIEEIRFELSCPDSCAVDASPSVVEKDRFRVGERNEAGDRDVFLSSLAAIDAMGASRLSSFVELV
jgi:hypothetical protein